MKLKIHFVKFEKALAMQVLEQDKRFISDGHKPLEYNASNGIVVRSYHRPVIGYDFTYLHLRGADNSDDLRVSRIGFVSNEARDEQLEKYLMALKEWAENAPEFESDVERVKSVSEQDVYWFD